MDWNAAMSQWAGGSSPRVRGIREKFPGEVTFRRFIPACAGNSIAMPGIGVRRPVHPRVCGEQS